MNWDILKELCDSPGVPGYEEKIAQILEREFAKTLVVNRDKNGNVIGEMKGDGKRLMLGAHMDEIGMMVKYITEKGFLKFIKLGGIDDRILLNQRVAVWGSEGVKYGVVGNKPPHLQKEEDRKKIIESKSLFIDVGARSRDEVKQWGIKIGDPVTFDTQTRDLGAYVTGKAIDNRVGCFVLTELSQRISGRNVLFVGTTQEEVSSLGKGAMLSAYSLNPDFFIAVDVSIATDHPECSEDENPVSLDRGPVITLVEASGRGNISDRKLVRWLIETALENNIPYQVEVVEGGATDASHVFNVKEGIPSVAVNVPARYIHSTVGVVSKSDIQHTVLLLTKAIEKGIL